MSRTLPVVQIKEGFRWEVYTPAGFRLLAVLDGLARRLGHDITLTAGTNDHQPPDPHALGNAFDVRVHDWSTQDILDARVYLQAQLGPLFTVLYEVPVRPESLPLQAIAYVNSHATAPHYHVQLSNQVNVFPPPPPVGLLA